MTKQNGDRFDPQWFQQGSPTNTTYVETFPLDLAKDNCTIATTGVANAVRIGVNYGDVLTNFTFVTATTAAGTPTAGYACVRNAAGTVVATTADFGSTARAANTAFTVAFATPYLVTDSGLYYAEISFTAGTIPTLLGIAKVNAVANGAVTTSRPVRSVSHGSAVGATPPATVATPTTVANVPYFALT